MTDALYKSYIVHSGIIYNEMIYIYLCRGAVISGWAPQSNQGEGQITREVAGALMSFTLVVGTKYCDSAIHW